MQRLRPLASFALAALASLAASGCTAPVDADGPSAASSEALRTQYVDLLDFVSTSPTAGADQDRYFAMTRALKAGFDDVCGDTFCEGDYGNLEALSFRCAVSSKAGKIRSCVWVFAGSYETVDARTGEVQVNAKTFTCKIPVSGTARELLDALAGDGATPAIRRPLPGGTASAYDALVGCL